MSSVFKKYRMTRKNVLLLAQAIINVHEKLLGKIMQVIVLIQTSTVLP